MKGLKNLGLLPIGDEPLNLLELKYRRLDPMGVRVGGSRVSYELLRGFYDECMDHREQFVCLYLSKSNRVLCGHLLGLGGVSGCVVDPVLIFQGMLMSNASGLILSHNHPSGNLSSSVEDDKMTRRIQECCRLMGFTLLDHLILTREGYMSFADEGKL